jgi:hypothetical protein
MAEMFHYKRTIECPKNNILGRWKVNILLVWQETSNLLYSVTGPVLASVLCVRARRRPISKGGRGMKIILKKLYRREKLGIWEKFLDLSSEIRLDSD